MPRFLNTWTGVFEWHNDLKNVRYAILSHVWRTAEEGGEQTYDDVCRIQATAKAARKKHFRSRTVHWPQFPHRDETSPSDSLYASVFNCVSVIFSAESPLSNKIKGLCKVARDAGFDLVWNDTCCIDKSSSAELSEAINSMYEWYRLSDMCYVYLADVLDGDDPKDPYSKFWESKWHTRGWTLQELIAPGRIIFLASSWNVIGTKLGLAGTLSQITRIDINILLGQAPMDSASVAQRMSWAAERRTTRIEDRAYSLLGLFGVHMSPIYGEGTNAFLRLQEEVIRSIPDQSVFAWGEARRLVHLVPCLLALSPFSFLHSTVRPLSRLEFASRIHLQGLEDVPPLDCVFAPQGARMRLLCLDLTEVEQHIQLIPRKGDGACRGRDHAKHRRADRLALLQCEDRAGRLVGLAFHSSDIAGGERGSFVGTHCNCSGAHPFRTIPLPRYMLARILQIVKPETAEVFLLRHRSDTPPSKSFLPHESLPALDLWLGDRDRGADFSLSPDSVENLRALGFTVSPVQSMREELKITLGTTLAWRDGDLLRSIRLCLSLELLDEEGSYYPGSESVEFRLKSSRAVSLSPRFASDSTVTSCATADLEVPDSDFEQIHVASTEDIDRCITLVEYDLLIRPFLKRPRQARLLQLSLERPPEDRLSAPNSSRTILLVMKMNEEHKQVSETRCIPSGSEDTATERANGASECDSIASLYGSDSSTSLPPSHSTTSLPPSYSATSPRTGYSPNLSSHYLDTTTTRRAALEERIDSMGLEKPEERMDSMGLESGALCAQAESSTATSKLAKMKSEVAALLDEATVSVSQDTAITSDNAELENQTTMLVSRMAAMWQKLDALTAAAAATSSQPAYCLGDATKEQADRASRSYIISAPKSTFERPYTRLYPPRPLPAIIFPSPDAITQRAALQEKVDALRRENSVPHAQLSTVTVEMKSEAAVLAEQNVALSSQNVALSSQNVALASQNVALVSQNAALEAQMGAMSRRLDALAAAAAAAASK